VGEILDVIDFRTVDAILSPDNGPLIGDESFGRVFTEGMPIRKSLKSTDHFKHLFRRRFDYFVLGCGEHRSELE
jgi:hypothetical protein